MIKYFFSAYFEQFNYSVSGCEQKQGWLRGPLAYHENCTAARARVAATDPTGVAFETSLRTMRSVS